MNLQIREQSGTDVARKFDYQMAVALDYLLSEYKEGTIILIETLEDFAVLHDLNTANEKVDIFQVKTKNAGLYTKSSILENNVIGKIILTDFYFDSKANTLNIICNTNLKGSKTEHLSNFKLVEKLSPKELNQIKENVAEYIKCEPRFSEDIQKYTGKLIYIKSDLPFSEKQERYSEMLIGKTNNIISEYLDDENHCISPSVIFNTLKLLINKKRSHLFNTSSVELEEAIDKKGIKSDVVKEVIDKAVELSYLTKKEILHLASTIYPPKDFISIKEEYPRYLSYRANLSDKLFSNAKRTVKEEYEKLTPLYASLDEIALNVTKNCANKIPYYSLPIIQILTIVVIYS